VRHVVQPNPSHSYLLYCVYVKALFLIGLWTALDWTRLDWALD